MLKYKKNNGRYNKIINYDDPPAGKPEAIAFISSEVKVIFVSAYSYGYSTKKLPYLLNKEYQKWKKSKYLTLPFATGHRVKE